MEMEQKKKWYYNCSVDGCLNSSINSKFSFFKLPTVPERRNEWLRLINREDILTSHCFHARVCEAHFCPNSVMVNSKRKLLRKKSIPQLLLPTKRIDTETDTNAREIVSKVYDFMKKEAVNKSAEKLTDARWRTSQAVGVSESTVTRILMERGQSIAIEETGADLDELLGAEPSAPAPGPSAPKRTCHGLDTDTSRTESPPKDGQDAVTTKTEYDDNEVPLHSDLNCTVCHNDIIGFRYICIQCTDWDMCAACEARGEHPAHYVLRLPAPKPRAEIAGVLAAIRTQIDELLRLRSEMQEIAIKEEAVEVKEEIEIEVTEHNPTEDMYDRSVPEVNVHERSCTMYSVTENATIHSEAPICTEAVRDTKATRRTKASKDTEATRRTGAARRTGSTRNIGATRDTKATRRTGAKKHTKASRETEGTKHTEGSRETEATKNTSTSGYPEKDEEEEAVAILPTIKTELNDDPLATYDDPLAINDT